MQFLFTLMIQRKVDPGEYPKPAHVAVNNKRSCLKQGGRKGLTLKWMRHNSQWKVPGEENMNHSSCIDVTDFIFWNMEYLLCPKVWGGIK